MLRKCNENIFALILLPKYSILEKNKQTKKKKKKKKQQKKKKKKKNIFNHKLHTVFPGNHFSRDHNLQDVILILKHIEYIRL